MQHGTYIGPRKELKELTAILRNTSEENYVIAQFDFNGTDMNEKNDGGPLNYLCFDWHTFRRGEFKVDDNVGG